MVGVSGVTQGRNLPTDSETDKVTRSEIQSSFEPGLPGNCGAPQPQDSIKKPKLVAYTLSPDRFYVPKGMNLKGYSLLSDSDDENDLYSIRHSLIGSSSSSSSNSSFGKRKGQSGSSKPSTPKKLKRNILNSSLSDNGSVVSFLSPERNPSPKEIFKKLEDSLLCFEEPWFLAPKHGNSPSYISPECSPVLPSWSTPNFPGFPNFGNTCYVNATLQALLAIPEFTKSFEKPQFSAENTDCIAVLLQKIILARNSNLELQVRSAMLEFHHSLPNIHSSYLSSGQQDASEFLMRLLDHIKLHLPQKKIERIFEFQVAEIRTCSNCGKSDQRSETHSLLWLPISGSPNYTLIDCLSEYFSPDDQRPLVCPKCDHKHLKVVNKISTLPRVMLLTIKRYSTMNEKINHPVIPPLELDVSTFIEKPVNGSTHYQLKSLILHLGLSNDSGHYVCYVQNDADKLWRLYNDEKVDLASENDIQDSECNRNAYVYFYLRRDSPK